MSDCQYSGSTDGNPQRQVAWRPAAVATAALVAALIGAPSAASADEGGGPTFTWGGYVKFDAIYNTTGRDVGPGGSDLGDYFLVPHLIPIDGQAEDDGGLNLNARESRFWLKTELDTDYGPFKTYIEVDLYGFNASLGDERLTNSSTVRLRHAYGQLGGFMLGQYWSTFMDLAALPEKIDFGTPAGRVFARQAMIRYTHQLSSGSLDIALENPETTLTAGDGTNVTRDDDLVPDVIVRYTHKGDGYHVSAAAMGRALISDASGDTELGIGVAGRVSGRVDTIGKDNFKVAVNGGLGLGRYMALNAYTAGAIDVDGSIAPTPVVGAHTSYQHWWSDTTRSSLVLSYSQAFNDTDLVPESVNKSLLTVHANLCWNPIAAVRVGIEGIFAQHTIESGDSGELIRAQGSVRYVF